MYLHTRTYWYVLIEKSGNVYTYNPTSYVNIHTHECIHMCIPYIHTYTRVCLWTYRETRVYLLCTYCILHMYICIYIHIYVYLFSRKTYVYMLCTFTSICMSAHTEHIYFYTRQCIFCVREDKSVQIVYMLYCVYVVCILYCLRVV